MPNPRDEADRLLRAGGATLIRSKRHEVWRLPNGEIFVRPQTPSCARGTINSLVRLRRLLARPRRLNDDGR